MCSVYPHGPYSVFGAVTKQTHNLLLSRGDCSKELFTMAETQTRPVRVVPSGKIYRQLFDAEVSARNGETAFELN